MPDRGFTNTGYRNLNYWVPRLDITFITNGDETINQKTFGIYNLKFLSSVGENVTLATKLFHRHSSNPLATSANTSILQLISSYFFFI